MADEKILSIDEILAEDDVRYATIPGYKPGEFLRIRSLDAADVIEWRESNEDAKGTIGIRLIIKSLVDAEGNRIATDKHIAAFKQKSHKRNEEIIKEIIALNGMRAKD